MPVPGEERGRGLGPPPRDAGKPVRAVADQSEVVGDGGGGHTESLDDHRLVTDESAPPVELDDARSPNHLGEVLVRRADQHSLDPRVLGSLQGRGAQRVVRLQLHHGPNDHAEGAKPILEGFELDAQLSLDPVPYLVTRPEVVAERLDDVVGRHTHVGRAALQHPEHGGHHAPHCRELVPLPVPCALGKPVEMAEQLVGAVDDMDVHRFRDWAAPCMITR